MTRIVIARQPRIVSDPGMTLLNRKPRPVLTWEQGEPGADAKVGFSIQVQGSYGARASLLLAPIILEGVGSFAVANCHGQSFLPCLAPNTWSVTLDGTFADEAVASSLEVAAALFATIAFPAGPGSAAWTFPSGGAYTDGQVLRIWQSATPDSNQDRTSLTFAGA